MKKALISGLFSLMLASLFTVPAFAEELIVGGQVLGIQISTEGVLVAELSELETEDGTVSPAAEAGIKPGDLILKIDGKEVYDASSVISAVEQAEDSELNISIRRGAKDMELNPDCGYWFFKRPYIDRAFYSDLLDEYRDSVFWEELVARLSARTLVECYGQDAVDAMTPEERASHVAAMEKTLWGEVSRYGVDRLMFMLAPEDS